MPKTQSTDYQKNRKHAKNQPESYWDKKYHKWDLRENYAFSGNEDIVSLFGPN